MKTEELVRELASMAVAHSEITHHAGCQCETLIERMQEKLEEYYINRRAQEQMGQNRHISTTADLEDWFEYIDRTAQITYRVKLSPTYLVRIVKDPERHEESVARMYVQATGDSLGEAFERCLDAYLKDGWVPEEFSGHLGETKIE